MIRKKAQKQMFNVGDKVRIVPVEKLRLCRNVNREGRMDHWAGEVMTIREVAGDDIYYMQEDKDEFKQNYHDGWVWDSQMIEGLAFAEISIKTEDMLSFLSK